METYQGDLSLSGIEREVKQKLRSISQKEFNLRNGVSVGIPERIVWLAFNRVWEKYWQWYRDLYINNLQIWLVGELLRIAAKKQGFELPDIKTLRAKLPFIHRVKPAHSKMVRAEYATLMNSTASHTVTYVPTIKKKSRKKKIYKCASVSIANQLLALLRKEHESRLPKNEVYMKHNTGITSAEFPYSVVIEFAETE